MATFVVRAATIQSLLKARPHPFDATRVRETASLGDQVGLKKTGIHKTWLAPHMVSTVEHFHDCDEEWFYILRGGGTLLCAGECEDIAVSAGDFAGFTTASRQPHAFRAGEEGMEYLIGGNREPVDICHYPLIGKALVINRGGENIVVDEKVK
ncbi:cupin domain-containing protein [Mycena pura]|uniref:Cupin domain-containing protein n=1 Tax=Mycena pura TaxID=153505 RepID=A0AAD7E430_9AGAR|nr:cupin domain-containing protein [Mycena pura]